MKNTLNFHQFHDQFKSIRPDDFTYDGLRALFNYLEEYEEGTGEEIEFDAIALTCDYTEYDIEDLLDNYSNIPVFKGAHVSLTRHNLSDEEREEVLEMVFDKLQDLTQVIRMDNGDVIIQNF